MFVMEGGLADKTEDEGARYTARRICSGFVLAAVSSALADEGPENDNWRLGSGWKAMLW